LNINRYDIILKPDNRRVLYRPFDLKSKERIIRIISRVHMLSEEEVSIQLQRVLTDFHKRHEKLLQFFYHQFEQYKDFLILDNDLSDERKLLLGAYFTQEYSYESSGLFNPSLVWHPDQSGLPNGAKRFIMSLRAVGEGHISSITFRSGVIDKDYIINIDTPLPFVTEPRKIPNYAYEKEIYKRKLEELGLIDDFSTGVLSEIRPTFTLDELQEIINRSLRKNRRLIHENTRTADGMVILAISNYEVQFSAEDDISERVIFPSSMAEANGIEDARFVEFKNDDGSVTYYALYTAFDGRIILPQLLETRDFLNFRINTLNGPAIENKGMALFPRRINGRYAMLSRQDNENNYIMFSDSIHFWYKKQLLIKPFYPWEFVQVGNCGSPIETNRGWLVLSHGVGPMRKYVIGAYLLDLDDPTRVIGRLREPLLSPNENEREGYVPNVVYSCGSLVFGDTLIIPYAMSDYASSFTSVKLSEVLDELER